MIFHVSYILGHREYGVSSEDIAKVDGGADFLCCLEDSGLLGENVLYFLQFLLEKLEKQTALDIVSDYASSRDPQKPPIILRTIKRRGKNGKRNLQIGPKVVGPPLFL